MAPPAPECRLSLLIGVRRVAPFGHGAIDEVGDLFVHSGEHFLLLRAGDFPAGHLARQFRLHRCLQIGDQRGCRHSLRLSDRGNGFTGLQV